MHIAIDLDGTLAHYDGWKGNSVIGKPIPAMVKILKDHIEKGDTVSIFTSRVSEIEDSKISRHHIKKWLEKHGLPKMHITAIKHKKFKLFYDDRAISIIKNTGETNHG